MNNETGGWSAFRTPQESDLEFFKKALERVDLVPVNLQLCAQQVVDGSNFIFIGNDNAGNGYIIASYIPAGKDEVRVDVQRTSEAFKLFNLR